jgi:hypothetical protein
LPPRETSAGASTRLGSASRHVGHGRGRPRGEPNSEGHAIAGAIDPSGRRNRALDAFLETKVREGCRIETHTHTHAIIIDGGNRKRFLSRLLGRGAGNRYVVSVDEQGEVTMIAAEPIRS